MDTTAWRAYTCSRCGRPYYACVHTNTAKLVEADHAERIRARYEWGRRFNPDHDQADYFTEL